MVTDYNEAGKLLSKEMETVCKAEDYMSAEDMCKIFADNFPKTFDYWFTLCHLLYEGEHGDYIKFMDKNRNYWDNDDINFARAILYDMKKEFANRLGKILVAATEN